MNLFENLQIMKEANNNINSQNDFEVQEAKKYGITEKEFQSNYLHKYISLDKVESFINEIKNDGYYLLNEEDLGEDGYIRTFGKEINNLRNTISISIFEDEDTKQKIVDIASGYDDRYNYDDELFENLQLMRENNDTFEMGALNKASHKDFVIKLPCEYMTDDEIKEYTDDAKKYNVDVKYDIIDDYDSYITISGSPENVKRYIDKEYARFNDVVDDYEDYLRNAYDKYNPNASEDEINKFLYESSHQMNETLSESKFKQPSRIRFKSEKLKQNKELFNKINIQAELLLDNNGEYVVCLPGTKDWVDLIKELLDADVESIGSNI